MSLLHNPTYTELYDYEDDSEELKRLLWSQFGCKCGLCDVESGKRFMERLPVFILDDIAREDRMRFDVELAYTCKRSADKLSLPSNSPHRTGLGVKIRLLDKTKRIKLVRGLILRGVTRFIVDRESFYFDTDDLKPMCFVVG